jgi:hypothetical protein
LEKDIQENWARPSATVTPGSNTDHAPAPSDRGPGHDSVHHRVAVPRSTPICCRPTCAATLSAACLHFSSSHLAFARSLSRSASPISTTVANHCRPLLLSSKPVNCTNVFPCGVATAWSSSQRLLTLGHTVHLLPLPS